MTIQEIWDKGKDILQAAGVLEYKEDAWLLLSYVTGVSKAIFLCNRNMPIPKEQEAYCNQLFVERAKRIPLQYLTGEQGFMGLIFQVNPHVLIPRQDTESLVEEAGKILKEKQNARVLDLCTGSGCIIISLACFYKFGLAVGADISGEALKVARENAKRHKVDVSFIQSDLFTGISGKFDIIISNPPYIRTGVIASLEPEVREYEPILALNGKEDGLYFYQNIIKQAEEYLVHGGDLLFEIGYDQGEQVSGLLASYGYTDIKIKKDLAGLNRVCMGKRKVEKRCLIN